MAQMATAARGAAAARGAVLSVEVEKPYLPAHHVELVIALWVRGCVRACVRGCVGLCGHVCARACVCAWHATCCSMLTESWLLYAL